MDIEVERYLGNVERSVSSLERDGKPAHALTLARSYDTTVNDLWDAVTNVKRISRWFLPVSGELKLGGRYQLEGNASGVITACEQPSLLALTWEYDNQTSWVEVHLSEQGGSRSRLRLTHIALISEHWNDYGPGAAGVGWDLGLLGLTHHLAQAADPPFDEGVFSASPEGRVFIKRSSEGWGQASIAAGTEPRAALAAAARTTAFYTGEPAAPA